MPAKPWANQFQKALCTDVVPDLHGPMNGASPRWRQWCLFVLAMLYIAFVCFSAQCTNGSDIHGYTIFASAPHHLHQLVLYFLSDHALYVFLPRNEHNMLKASTVHPQPLQHLVGSTSVGCALVFFVLLAPWCAGWLVKVRWVTRSLSHNLTELWYGRRHKTYCTWMCIRGAHGPVCEFNGTWPDGPHWFCLLCSYTWSEITSCSDV